MIERWNLFRERYGRYGSPILFFFSLVLLDFSFRLFHSGVASTVATFWVPNVFTLCWSAILTLITVLIPGKAKKIVMALLLGAFVFLVLVHSTLYHVSGTFLSFSDFAFAEDGAAFFSLQYLTFSWKIYLYAAISLAIGIGSVILAPNKQKYHWIGLLIVGALLALAITGIALIHSNYYRTGTGSRFAWTNTYDPTAANAAYTEFCDPNECVMFCGNYQYLFRCLTQSAGDFFRYHSVLKELDEFYASRPEKAEPNEMTGVLKGQNAIAIMLESIDTWMITPEFMPNLYSIQEKSMDFKNHYTPLFLSAGTFNTEFAFNIGYYLPSTGTTARTYATNIYPNSLPNLFKNAGYITNSYHTLDGRFYNRQLVHPLWGYEAFNDHDNMCLYGDQTRDTTLMEAYDMFVSHEGSFFDYIITYSGHGPYTEVRNSIALPNLVHAKRAAADSGITTDNESTWSQFERAVSHAMETDAFIGDLLAAMQADGTIHNTTLIFFADHYSKYLTDTSFVMKLKGVSDQYHLCRTPFFIYSEKMEEPITVEKVTSSVDLIPTIANLFGLDYNARYLIGNDAFGTGGGYVCFKDYTWIDSEQMWTSDARGEETEEIKERCREVRELLRVSWNTVKTNYFQYLEDKK